MLDFCPFDFKKIDMNNLAYELTFPNGWSWERVKRDTVVGEDKKFFINENDKRQTRHYKDDKSVKHIVLLENGKKGGKNGFKIFCEYLEYKKEERKKENLDHKGSGGGDEDFLSKYASEFQAEDEEGKPSEPILLEYKKFYGIDTFVDENGDEVMYAIPCCPHCHNRLPIGWETAEDFAAVSLRAGTGGGKTTFLYSMMQNNWSAFRQLESVNGKKIHITAAHRNNDPTDSYYNNMCMLAQEMCRDFGKCPGSTQRDKWIPPVFLNVQYGGHTMILGIYDNAGENLEKPDPDKNPQLKMLLDKMFADIYLFDPKNMNLALPGKKEKVRRNYDEDCRMLDIQEQGKFQEEHRDKVITARELLFENKKNTGSEESEANNLTVYDNTLSIRQQYCCLERMKEMYFLGVIIKCDLLEQVEEIKKNHDYDALFERGTPEDLLDLNNMTARSGLIKQMIQERQLLGNRDLESFQAHYGELMEDGVTPTGRNAVSWHCVSALGCDAEMGGKLLGKYRPIRVAEPLVTCILKRIADNKWLEGE